MTWRIMDNEEQQHHDMLRLTLTQIAAHIGQTERNVANRLRRMDGDKRKITATDNGDGTYAITQSELDRHTTSAQSARNRERLTSLEARQTTTESRLDELEGMVRILASLHEHAMDEGHPDDPEQLLHPLPTASHYASVDALPEGSIGISTFANMHGFQRRTLLAELLNKSNHLEHEAFAVPNRPRERDRYLTPEQQRVIIRFWRAHHKKFTECALCRQGKH